MDEMKAYRKSALLDAGHAARTPSPPAAPTWAPCRPTEVPCEQRRVQRGAHQHHLERSWWRGDAAAALLLLLLAPLLQLLSARGQEIPQQGDQEVGLQGALMHLVVIGLVG